jgi:hypothetical protein
VLEATAAAREAESQLIWVTAEARNVERDFDHIIAEARTLLDKELQRRLESEASGRSKVDNSSGSSCTAECLSLRLEALEVHVNARLESLEESVSTFWDELQKEIQKSATYRVEESLKMQTMINKSLEVERVERNKLMEEEKTRHEERQAALARALGEELEASIVAQAVAEVRKAACTAAQEEAKAQVERLAPPKEQMQTLADSSQQLSELQQKVSDLERRWRDSGFSSWPLPKQLDAKAEPAGSVGRSADKGVMALQQFGVSVVQLESNINSLLKSSLEARAEQNQQHTNVHEEMKQLRSEINTIANQDIARLWEQLQKLEGGYCGKLESVCKENSIGRSCSPSPPNGVPQWRLAMVPSPARSPHGHDRCSKSQQGSLAVRVASPPPRQTDPTPATSRSTSPGGRFTPAHGGRRSPHTTPGISLEAEAGARGGAISPGRPSARGGKLVTSCIPGPPRRTLGT